MKVKSILFQENVKSTISSATLTGATTISVKFSENMLDTSLTDSMISKFMLMVH
jgi:hypothetical protein